MLNRVPAHVNYAVRQVVLRHANSMDCFLLRKEVKRTESVDGQDQEMAGLPTIGGMGVLDSEDEQDFDYEEIGDGRALICGTYEPQSLNSRQDSPVQRLQQEVQIEPVAEPGTPGWFDVQKRDIVVLLPGMGVGVALEIVDIIGNVNIPPYTQRYICNPRDDLHHLEPFIDEPDAQPEPEPPVSPNIPTR